MHRSVTTQPLVEVPIVGNPRKSGRLRVILVGSALVAMLALPTVVSADTTPGGAIAPASSNGATIAVDPDVAVMSRVVAVVDISFTCDPLLVYDWETGLTQPTTAGRLEYASVAIVQASGRSIASGTAEFSGGDVVCDGTTANIRSAAVVASTLPWKSGGAVAGASIYVTDGEYQSSHSASSGPISVKLGK